MREYQETDVCSFPTEEDAVKYYKEWYRKYGYPDYDEDSDYDDDGDEIDPFTKHNAKIIKIDTQKAEEEKRLKG